MTEPAGEDRKPETPRYFTAGQVGWATAMASPYAGVLMLAANLRTFEKPDMAKKALAYGALCMAAYVMLALSVKLPAAFGMMFFAMTGVLFTHLTHKHQGRDIKYLAAQGFPPHRLWQVVKLSACGLLLLFASSYACMAVLMLAGVDVLAIHAPAADHVVF